MGSYGLPALSIHPPEQQDLLGKYAQIQRIQSGQQQQQIQQEQLKGDQLANQKAQRDLADQQAVQEELGKTHGDLNAALPALSQRISPSAFIGLSKAGRELSDQARKSTSEELDLRLKQNNSLLGLIDQAKNLPPDQYPQQYPNIIAQAKQIKPDLQIPEGQMIPQQALGNFALGLMTHTQYDEQEKMKREADKQAETVRHDQAMEKTAGGDSVRFTNDYLAAKHLPDTPQNRQTAFAAFTKMTKVDPGVERANVYLQRPIEVASPDAPGETVMVRASQAPGMAGKGSASTQTVKAEEKYMTSGKGGQQLTAFNTAMTHLDVLDKLAADLNNTNLQIANKAKQAFAEQTGNPAPANFAAAKNAMAGEVAAALKASGATDQEITHVSDTFSKSQSPAQLKGAIQTYRTLLGGKRDQLKAQYEQGVQGKPNFGSQGGLSVTAPNGKTYTFKDQASLDNFKKSAGIQ